MQVRGWYSAVYIGVDLVRGLGGPRSTIGNLPHLAGFVAGLCYVLLAVPALGGAPLPTVPCAATHWGLGHGADLGEACIAFFSPRYGAPVDLVRRVAASVLCLGVTAALVNAFVCRRSVDTATRQLEGDVWRAMELSRQAYAAQQQRSGLLV